MSDQLQLALRAGALGLVLVIVQITAISQITLLGVSADLTPLIVASTGLLAGSIAGALMGFSLGLFVDLALVQTLGVTSLVLTIIGYAAGRLHEVRDPSHSLVPLAVGAAATAAAQIGYSLLQVLLGVDGPVSVLLVRQILAVTVIGTIIAVPVHALVSRVLGPALPELVRRRRRRAYTTGGLSPLSRS
jgi:rod shape-determining protein MreD